MACHTYILKSLKDGKFYYGSTTDLSKRIKKHNAGGVPSTKHRRPLELFYSEAYETIEEAFKREMFFKTIDGHNWLKAQKIT
jgi:putative endonuclease